MVSRSLSFVAGFLGTVSVAFAAPEMEGISWPEGQPLPAFAKPAEKLDALIVQDLVPDEQITFSALQGLVNRRQPRFILLDRQAGEGRDTWLETPSNGIRGFTIHSPIDRYAVIAKYADEFSGVVLYDVARSEHYRNLAGTVAGLERALPVTRETLRSLASHGWDPKIVADLTGLEFTSATGIYRHLREKYWDRCTKRLLQSSRPFNRHGDFHHTRDLAAACGAAVVWLDPRKKDERALLSSFFHDMPAGDAVALGWYATERSGITTASEAGIGTIPSDFFNGATVFAGAPREIAIPAVPKMPEPKEKIYIAMFISDGDNIQYVQHAMRMFWDRSAPVRGRVPLNWTIAPGLVDVAPGLLNYYYGSATANDCFVSGPSGMGYLMPVNTLEEEGAPVGTYSKDMKRFDGYTRLTGRYAERAGLRVVTIWDNATPDQRASYERNCPNLYGLTVQNFRDMPSVAESVENKRLRFEKLRIPYAGSYDDLVRDIARARRRWDEKEPLFLAYQMDIWNDMKPARVVELHDHLQREFPGRIEFVRADHFFNLRNQAGGLPYNLCMDPATQVRASGGDAAAAVDGTPATRWTAPDGEAWLAFDFGAPRTLARCVVTPASPKAPDAIAVQTSKSGATWSTIHVCRDLQQGPNVVRLPGERTRYLRLVAKPAAGSPAALAEVEIHGRR